MFKAIKTAVLKMVRNRQLTTLHKHVYSGAVFLRILNDELSKLPRHKRKRFIRALYHDCKISEEIIKHCEIKSDYIIKTMKGQLKVFKRKKAQERKAQRKAGKKDVKKMTKGAQEIKPNKTIKPEQVLAGGEPYKPKKPLNQETDGAEYYKRLKELEAKGELPEQKKDKKDPPKPIQDKPTSKGG